MCARPSRERSGRTSRSHCSSEGQQRGVPWQVCGRCWLWNELGEFVRSELSLLGNRRCAWADARANSNVGGEQCNCINSGRIRNKQPYKAQKPVSFTTRHCIALSPHLERRECHDILFFIHIDVLLGGRCAMIVVLIVWVNAHMQLLEREQIKRRHDCLW